MDVYLDFNIYLSIIKKEMNKEIDYRYVLAKLRFLRRKRNDIKFPYSPAHMEEVAVNVKSGRHKHLIAERLKLIEFYSRRFQYLPGFPAEHELRESLKNSPDSPELKETRRIWIHLLNRYELGLIDESIHAKVRKEFERPYDCFKRVVGDLGATDWAHRNEIYKLGRRNENSIKSNFEFINEDPSGVETFEDFHKKNKLGPRVLSNLGPTEVFESESVLKCFSEYLDKESVSILIKGNKLLEKHSVLELYMEHIMIFLEKIGFNQEDNNKPVKLRSRMHDVTHSIYGAHADYFVTNDIRFRSKLQAAYYLLEIPCKVISPDMFVKEGFTGEVERVIYT